MSSSPNIWVMVTVPIGKRAVIMTWTAANFDTVAASGYARIGPYYPVSKSLPVGSSVQVTELRLVAYGGEEVGILNSGMNMHSMLCGYLFDDPAGALKLERHYERAIDPAPLPADLAIARECAA